MGANMITFSQSLLTESVNVNMTKYSYQFLKDQAERWNLSIDDYLKLLIMEEHNRHNN